MLSCTRSTWPPRLVTVPGLHGSEGAHWQSWLERQFARSLRVEQADWDAPDVVRWAQSLRDLLARERGPFVLAAHSFGCLATAHALQQAPEKNANRLPASQTGTSTALPPEKPARYKAGVKPSQAHMAARSVVRIASGRPDNLPKEERAAF